MSALNRPTAPSATSRVAPEDPWPSMERQVVAMLNDLTVQVSRVRDTANPTVLAENELLEAIGGCGEAVEDMRFAFEQAMNHPESFAITTDDLQSRAEKIREWERDIARAQTTGEKIRVAQRRREQEQDASDPASAGGRENNDFLKQEHEVQRDVMATDEQTLGRLQEGVHRVRDTAVNINDELNTQEHVLNDIDTGITRVQMKIDGAMKKVGKLIDQTSDRGKMICIAVLFVVLILLIVFVVR